ncbi:hypothetical protein RI367_005010 [Sorochytrium milnesiophthora]
MRQSASASLTWGAGSQRATIKFKAPAVSDLQEAFAFPMNATGVNFAVCATPYAKCRTLPLNSLLGQPLLDCQNKTCASNEQDARMYCSTLHCPQYFTQIYGDVCIPLTDPILLQHNITVDVAGSTLDRTWTDQMTKYWTVVNSPKMRDGVARGTVKSGVTMGACMLAPPIASPCTSNSDSVTQIPSGTAYRKVAACVDNKIQPLALPGAACVQDTDCVFGDCDATSRHCTAVIDVTLGTESVTLPASAHRWPLGAIIGVACAAAAVVLALSLLLARYRRRRHHASKALMQPVEQGTRVRSVYVAMPSRLNRRSIEDPSLSPVLQPAPTKHDLDLDDEEECDLSVPRRPSASKSNM